MAGLDFTSKSIPQSDKVLNGGLNSTAGPLGLNNNESSDLLNIDFDKFGSILKRNGYLHLNASATSGTNLSSDGLWWYEASSAGSAVRFAINVTGGKLLKMESVDGTWDDVSGALTITATNHCDFENYVNTVFVTNGEDLPFKWAGSGTANVMDVPTGLTKAKYVKQFNNYLFLANVTVGGVSYPSRLYWSALRDVATWDAADWIEVSKDDGEEITGLRVLSDRLVVYKEKSVYILFFTGDADIPFIMPGGGKTNSSVGCIAPWSICDVNNGHVFLSFDGLYFFDGNNSYKLTDKVRTTLFTDFNPTIFTSARGINYRTKNRYMLSFAATGQSAMNRLLIWDYFNNAFSIYSGMTITDMAIFFVSGVDERPYFTDASGYAYRMDIGTDDYPLKTKTAINAYYYTNWKHYEDLCDQKGIPNAYIYYRNNNTVLTFAYSYDFESTDQYSQTFSLSAGSSVYGTALYGTGVYGGSGGASQRRDLQGRGRVVRFKFANAVLSEQFRIDGFGTLPYLETNV